MITYSTEHLDGIDYPYVNTYEIHEIKIITKDIKTGKKICIDYNNMKGIPTVFPIMYPLNFNVW